MTRAGLLLLPALALAELPCDTPSLAAAWEFAGPAGYVVDGDPTHVASAGAAQAMAPLEGGGWLMATANGGIWRSEDISVASPRWTPALDGQPVACTSISAMEAFEGRVVLAGCGAATSSEMGYDWTVANAGDWGGLMISRDGGLTWAMLDAFPSGYFVTAVLVADASTFVVAARAAFRDRDDGGVWASRDGGLTWNRTLSRPVYDLAREPSSGVALAALPWTSDGDSVMRSASGGLAADWAPFAAGIDWGGGRTPFYATFALGEGVVFVGALTVNPQRLGDTDSGLFSRALADVAADSGGGWAPVAGAPRLDRDGMPKDRMALLVHPKDDETLFVAGNAEALVYRVKWRDGEWAKAWGDDTDDGSYPHADCRRYYWTDDDALIVLSDGGAHARDAPDAPGGRWRSLAGDIGAMELVSADWDPVGNRWVGGAQDNTVMVMPPRALPNATATGFINGDGTVTAVDAAASPPRLWGCTQNLGNFVDADAHPSRRLRAAAADEDDDEDEDDEDDDEDDDDDDDFSGFGFWTTTEDGAGEFVAVPLLKWFDVEQFPFFVQPFALVRNDPSQVLLYARGNGTVPGGIWRLDVDYAMRDADDLAPPTLEAATGDVYVLVAGGVTAGEDDPSVLVAVNDSALMHRSAASGGQLLVHALPERFAQPIVFEYDEDGEYILGPTSHDRTVALAVSPADSSLLAVAGWTSVLDNNGLERVWLSRDAGASFDDVTADLRAATATIGQVRPSALLLLPLPDEQTTALLVGTVSGVFVTLVGGGAPGTWKRLGECAALPLVLVAGLSHEPKDDTLVAATMGRGVYVLRNASNAIAGLF